MGKKVISQQGSFLADILFFKNKKKEKYQSSKTGPFFASPTGPLLEFRIGNFSKYRIFLGCKAFPAAKPPQNALYCAKSGKKWAPFWIFFKKSFPPPSILYPTVAH